MQITNVLSYNKTNFSTKPVENFRVQKNDKRFLLDKDTISFCSNMPLAKQINSYFYSGERHTFNRINKMKPNELRLVKEAIDIIKNAGETNKPFDTFTNFLQCNAGNEYVAVKKYVSQDGVKVNLRIVFDKNFHPTLSRTEYFDNSIVSWLKNGNKVLIDEIEFDEISSSYVSKNKFEIINDEFGVPEKLIHTKPNLKYPNFYEITEYKFKDFSEDIDLITEIKSGAIIEGKKLAWLEEGENCVTFYNNFSQNCTKTERKYIIQYAQNGEILSNEYMYKILDDCGNKILNVERKFVKNSDGTTTTIVGDKKYTSTFNDKKRQMTIVDNLGNKTKIPCIYNAYEMYKNIPADMILAMVKNYIQHIKIIENASDSSVTPNGIGYDIKTAIDSYEVFAHEIGHAIDNFNAKKLFDNDEIVEIYNVEWEIFKENNPEQSAKILQYFSQRSSARPMHYPHNRQKDDGGLRELVAETYLLLNYYGLDNLTNKRALALVQNFPNTIALIAQNL